MTTKTYQLATLTCPSCIAKIDKAVSSLPGVSSVKVLFNSSKVRVETDAQASPDVAKTIQGLGYEVISVEE